MMKGLNNAHKQSIGMKNRALLILFTVLLISGCSTVKSRPTSAPPSEVMDAVSVYERDLDGNHLRVLVVIPPENNGEGFSFRESYLKYIELTPESKTRYDDQ